MNAFNIKYGTETSEWLATMNDVQNESNKLEGLGIVEITINQFKNSVLVKRLNYSYNGQSWERV